MKRNDDGFTLLELMVTVVVLGIVTAIAVPLYLSHKQAAEKVAAQVEDRQEDTEDAYDEAMQDNDGNPDTAPFAPTAINVPSVAINVPPAVNVSQNAPQVVSTLRPCPSNKIVGQVGKRKCVVTGGKNFYIDPANDKK